MTKFFQYSISNDRLPRWDSKCRASAKEIFKVAEDYKSTSLFPIRHMAYIVLRWIFFPPVYIVFGVLYVFRAISGRMPVPTNEVLSTTLLQRVSKRSATMALWLVYVPFTMLECRGGLKGAVFLPSQAPDFQKDHLQNIDEGKKLVECLCAERDELNELLFKLKDKRRLALKKSLDNPAFIENPTNEIVGNLERHVSVFKRLHGHLKFLEERIKEIEKAAETMTTQKRTGFKGVAHWASETHSEYSNLLQAISAVSFVGAGLTYSSIFSATRGNLGLICWAFAMFNVSLADAITIQTLLLWCAAQDTKIPFTTTTLWSFFIRMAVAIGCICLVGAVVLLSVTVLLLTFDVTGGSSPDAVNSAVVWQLSREDSPLGFGVNPKSAAWVSLGVLTFGGIGVTLFLGLFWLANIFNLVAWRNRGDQDPKPLNEFDV